MDHLPQSIARAGYLAAIDSLLQWLGTAGFSCRPVDRGRHGQRRFAREPEALPAPVHALLATISSSSLAGLAAVYTLLAVLASLLPVPGGSCRAGLSDEPLVANAPRRVTYNSTDDWPVVHCCSAGDDLATVVPGNEIFPVDITEKTLALERLPTRLEGLTIAHLSDCT